jgi:hypothetical protein
VANHLIGDADPATEKFLNVVPLVDLTGTSYGYGADCSRLRIQKRGPTRRITCMAAFANAFQDPRDEEL